MHTPAAESQSLHEHSLAYVKQSPPPARLRPLSIILVGDVLIWSAPAERSGDGALKPWQNQLSKSGVALRLPPRSRLRHYLLVVVAGIVVTSACATLPRSLSSIAQSNTDIPKPQRASAININTASQLELEKLPGIGSGIAERIVAHREQYGPFRRAEHLMMVRGISDQKFRELRAMIVVE